MVLLEGIVDILVQIPAANAAEQHGLLHDGEELPQRLQRSHKEFNEPDGMALEFVYTPGLGWAGKRPTISDSRFYPHPNKQKRKTF